MKKARQQELQRAGVAVVAASRRKPERPVNANPPHEASHSSPASLQEPLNQALLPDLPTKPEKEAICFTAGVPAAAFAVGVIHAHLASNRAAPGVLAGVSMGALNAAAMQRCYLELEEARQQARQQGAAQVEVAAEASRWRWFRQYLDALTTRPLAVFWNAVPDQSDFFTDRTPVVDPTVGLFPEPPRGEYEDRHRNARRDLYLFVKLGHWFASLPIPFSEFANTVVSKVRASEKYPEPRIWRQIRFWIVSGLLLIRILFHIVATPKFFPEYKFRAPREGRGNTFLRGVIWVWDKIVRWLPVNHQPGLTWSLARDAFRAALGEAWKEEKETRSARRDQLQKKDWKTALSSNLTFLSGIVQKFFRALRTNYIVEFPFRPLFGWRVYSASVFLALLLVMGLTLSLWNFALPRLVVATRSFDFVASQPGLARPLAEAQFYLEQNRIQILAWVLKTATQRDFVKSRPWLQRRVSQAQEIQQAQKGLVLGLFVLIVVVALLVAYKFRRRVLKHILKKVELKRALIDDFHLRVLLLRLFGKDGKSPTVNREAVPGEPDPIQLLIAAASLQLVLDKRSPRESSKPGKVAGYQLWARPGAMLTTALRAALSVPGVLEPELVEGKDVLHWVDPTEAEVPEKLDLVDAAVIRQNPLPALFGFLKQDQKSAQRAGRKPLAGQLFSDEKHPAVHVVYGVPIHPEQMQLRESMDIVTVGRQSLQLARRRDTQLEVQQTRTLGRVQRQLDMMAGESAHGGHYPIFADELAPEREIRFANPLSPTRDEILNEAAHGCRRTLEGLFHHDLANVEGTNPEVDCPEFLAKLPQVRDRFPQGQASPALVGLPEVCSRCTQKLARGELVPLLPYDLAPTGQTLQTRKWKSLSARFPMLTRADQKPRIIFVASGGVFRGSFHAGMLGAMLATQIRPNLIVGASVGTLMGGTLAAMMSASSYRDALEILGQLVEVFLHVDEKVAFTKTLKTAARDLGLRGRLIHLSINRVRRAVKRGGRSDPGYAAVGAPPALIDAISTLFFIPHRATTKIAAEFVAGHVTGATRAFFLQLQKETLGQLDIRNALIGATLLEPVARQLLHVGGREVLPQPFPNIAFFGTTTNLATRRPFLLGFADVESYDFIKAALASSAFPCVFEPRRESEVFPNLGHPDVFYSDGGMFDNLPFFPALFALSETQKDFSKTALGADDWYKSLRDRHYKPDLILAGSLDANPTPEEKDFEDLFQVCQRASSLQNNVKIQSFVRAADMVDGQIEDLLQVYEKEVAGFHSLVDEFLASIHFPDQRPETQNFHAASQTLATSTLQLLPVSQKLADEFRHAADDLLHVVRDARKVDDALVQEFQGVTNDLVAALQKKEPDKSRIADLQRRTREMLSSIRADFQVNRALVDSLEGAAQEVWEAVRSPETISQALVRDLQAAAVSLLEPLGSLTPEEQTRVAKFRKALSELIRAIQRPAELDSAKLAAFESSAEQLAEAMQDSDVAAEKITEWRRLASAFVARLRCVDRGLMASLVNPGVLPIYPADRDHLNGTFHFCASMGMDRKRVRSSIANGCFQTLGTLADELKDVEGTTGPLENVTSRSLRGLLQKDRIPRIQWSPQLMRVEGRCPFFLHAAKPAESYAEHRLRTSQAVELFDCPFVKAGCEEAKKVYAACRKDAAHKKIFNQRRAREAQSTASKPKPSGG